MEVIELTKENIPRNFKEWKDLLSKSTLVTIAGELIKKDRKEFPTFRQITGEVISFRDVSDPDGIEEYSMRIESEDNTIYRFYFRPNIVNPHKPLLLLFGIDISKKSIELTKESLPKNSEKWLEFKKNYKRILIPKKFIVNCPNSINEEIIVGTIKLFHTIYTEDEDKEIYNIIIEDKDVRVYYFTHEPGLDYLYYVGSFDE